jgi:hypothetical protein
MNQSTTSLQIRIHEVTGSVTTFIQSDPDVVKQIVDGFQPSLIFNQERLIVADSHSHSAFPMPKVTRVDLNSDSSSQLDFRTDLIDAYELTKSQFKALIRNPVMSEQWHNLNPDNKSVVVFLEVIMVGDESILLTMDMNIDSTPKFNEMRENLLSRSALCFRMQNGGVTALNLVNLTRLTFFPGSLDMPANAWPARFFRPEVIAGDVTQPPLPKANQRIHLQAK